MNLVVGAVMVQAVAVAAPSEGETVEEQVVKGPKLNAVETAIVQQTNAVRAKYGRPPLTVDPDLLKSARKHAQWMTLHRSLRHTAAPVAENIALGQLSAKQAIREWMNSSGHRANILHHGFRRIGVAAYRGTDGRNYWCQQFLR